MTNQQYNQAQKRIEELTKRARLQAPDLSWEELHELVDLQEACQQYQDAAAVEEKKRKQEANDQIAMSMGYL